MLISGSIPVNIGVGKSTSICLLVSSFAVAEAASSIGVATFVDEEDSHLGLPPKNVNWTKDAVGELRARCG